MKKGKEKAGTLYEKILSRIPETLAWSSTLEIDGLREFLLGEDERPIVFLGSGGSYSAAVLASELSVGAGKAAVAMTPYQYIFSAWSKLAAKVLLFSASGRNVDAINAYRRAHANEQQTMGALLMSTSSTLESLMSEDGERNVFAYNIDKRDGFLATNSLVATYALLLRLYGKGTVTIDDMSFKADIRAGIKDLISRSLTLETASWDEHNAAVYGARETDRFYLLYSPDTIPIAYDIESRFSEGSVGSIQISDYRNFAHGRFNWFYQRKGQTAVLALITPESKAIAEGILRELPEYVPVMRIETEKSGGEAIMELLVKGMYLAHYIGVRWGLDIGAPEVADFGKVIHKKDFMGEGI